MKITFYFIAIYLFTSSCVNGNRQEISSTDSTSYSIRNDSIVSCENSTATYEELDLSDYQKFQRFDFCNLKGVGEVERNPYVLVKDSAEYRIVRKSHDINDAYIFKKEKDHWYNYRNFYPELPRDFGTTLNGEGPSDVHRFVADGVVYEYISAYNHEIVHVHYRVFTNTNSGYWFRHVPETEGEYFTGEELIVTEETFHKLKKKLQKWMSLPLDKLPYGIGGQEIRLIYTDTNIIEHYYFNNEYIGGASLPQTPLGELDDHCTEPRTFANNYCRD